MRPEPTLTAAQSRVLTLLANNRTPQSHVAGAVLTPPVFARLSDDLDLFHDVREHVLSCFEKDRETLESFGWDVKPIIGPRDGFVRAAVIDRKSRESVLIDWAYDSAVRFFPTQPDPVFGWRLHPVDAAVNKVIAAALRSDPKDVIDVLAWHGRPLSLGALAWAVPAKDPGLGPELVLDFIERARTPSLEQIKAMRFASERESEPPSPSDIRLALRQILGEARSLLDRLPPETVGCVFLSSEGQVVEPDPSKPETLIHPHAASQGGCVPRLADGPDMPPEPPGFILPCFRK